MVESFSDFTSCYWEHKAPESLRAATILGLTIGLDDRVEFNCKKGYSWDLTLCRDGDYLLQSDGCGEESEIYTFSNPRETFEYLKTLF